MGLRKCSMSVEHHFQEGGRFQKWYALYEVFDTFLYAPDSCHPFYRARARRRRPQAHYDYRLAGGVSRPCFTACTTWVHWQQM